MIAMASEKIHIAPSRLCCKIVLFVIIPNKKSIMHSKLLIAGLLLFVTSSCNSDRPPYENRASGIVAELGNPASRKVLVASHRGDWRNYPENSLPALRSAIDRGVDIVEIDLKMTSDSMLILMHDASIDRTTTGRGRVCDITFDSICKVSLRAGQGVATHWKVPTLEEALLLCKGRAVVNIDQGFQFYDRIHPLLERTGMLGQTLIKGRLTASEVETVFSAYSENCLFMPIVNFSKKHHDEILRSYGQLPTPPLACEVCWSEYTPDVEACMKKVLSGGSKLWVNSLWPSLNGGLCDDAAFDGDPAAVYGKLVDMGATLIQTDRPELLISYLRSRGLHD